MRKAIAATVMAGYALLFAAPPAFAADAKRPTVTYQTQDGQMFYVSVPNPAFESDVRGTARDTKSGIRKVVVRFTACEESEGACTASDTHAAVNDQVVLGGSELRCRNHRRTCSYSVAAPAAPGFYRVRTYAVDRAGNRSRTCTIRITVV